MIIAQDNARTRMSKEYVVPFINRHLPALPKVAVPIIGFEHELTLHLNDDEIQVVHVPNAHTDGDVLVYFRKAKVLHMGDLFSYKFSLPYIEIQSGGSMDGLIAAIKTALMTVPEDVEIIPGHGPIAGKSELRAYLAMLQNVRGKVAAARKAGRSLDQIKKMNIAPP